MECSKFRRMLDKYASLNDKEREELAEHAKVCEECGAEFEFFKSVIRTTASIPIPSPPSDLIAKVNRRLDEEPEPASAFNRAVSSARIYAKRYAAAAACLTVGLAVALNSGVIGKFLGDEEDDGVISSVVTEDNDNKGGNEDGNEQNGANGNAAATPAAETASAAPQAQPETATPSVTLRPSGAAAAASRPTESAAQPERTARPSAAAAAIVPRTSSASSRTESAVSRAKATAKPTTGTASASAGTANMAAQSSGTSETVVFDNASSAVVSSAESDRQPEETAGTTSTPVSSENAAAAAASAEDTALSGYTAAAGTDTSSETAYRIDDDIYVLPGASPAAGQRTAQPQISAEESEDAAIDGYLVSDSDYTVAMAETDESPGELVINPSDSAKVFAIMADMNIEYTDGYYTSAMSEFNAFLAKLGGSGVKYNYTISYNGVGKVKFKVVSYK